jgi:hypothetical protein
MALPALFVVAYTLLVEGYDGESVTLQPPPVSWAQALANEAKAVNPSIKIRQDKNGLLTVEDVQERDLEKIKAATTSPAIDQKIPVLLGVHVKTSNNGSEYVSVSGLSEAAAGIFNRSNREGYFDDKRTHAPFGEKDVRGRGLAQLADGYSALDTNVQPTVNQHKLFRFILGGADNRDHKGDNGKRDN